MKTQAQIEAVANLVSILRSFEINTRELDMIEKVLLWVIS